MPKPNIVFVHVDQMHHKAMSAYGCAHVDNQGRPQLVTYCMLSWALKAVA